MNGKGLTVGGRCVKPDQRNAGIDQRMGKIFGKFRMVMLLSNMWVRSIRWDMFSFTMKGETVLNFLSFFFSSFFRNFLCGYYVFDFRRFRISSFQRLRSSDDALRCRHR